MQKVSDCKIVKKSCERCDLLKSINEFAYNNTRYGAAGYQNICSSCMIVLRKSNQTPKGPQLSDSDMDDIAVMLATGYKPKVIAGKYCVRIQRIYDEMRKITRNSTVCSKYK